jgi:hypothetical protein
MIQPSPAGMLGDGLTLEGGEGVREQRTWSRARPTKEVNATGRLCSAGPIRSAVRGELVAIALPMIAQRRTETVTPASEGGLAGEARRDTLVPTGDDRLVAGYPLC